MNNILRYKDYIKEKNGEYRKGSDKYSGLVHDIMLYLRNFDIDKTRPVKIELKKFLNRVNTTEENLKNFLKDSTNLISFDIEIDDNYVIINNLNNVNKKRMIWETNF